MNTTVFIIAFTCVISYLSFNNKLLTDKLILWPYMMKGKAKEYYRLLTAGWIHADTMHLAFNMVTLYFFGDILESGTIPIGATSLVILYFSAIIISCIPSTLKHKNNPAYRSLGASGGVSAVVFATIYIYPWSKLYLFFIPIGIPCIIYAVLYLLYTIYMSRKGKGYINHDAHLWGSLYGILFMLVIDATHGQFFIDQIIRPFV